MLNSINKANNCAFVSFPEDCRKNILEVMSDFLLEVDEIYIVLLSVRN